MTLSPSHDLKPPSLLQREWPAIAAGIALIAGTAWAAPFLTQRWTEAEPHRAQLAAAREAREAQEEARRQVQPPIAMSPDAPEGALPIPPDTVAPARPPVVRQAEFISQPSFELPASVARGTPGIIWVYFDCRVTVQGRLADCEVTETPQGAGAAAYMRTQLGQVRLSPMTVDGEPRESRLNFNIRFRASSSPRPGPPAPPAPSLPHSASPADRPDPASAEAAPVPAAAQEPAG